MTDSSVIICDHGTGFQKIGYAGDNFPRHVIRTVVGYEEIKTGLHRKNLTEHLVQTSQDLSFVCGKEAIRRRNNLECMYPIKDGMIHNWDLVKKLWSCTFEDLLGNCMTLEDVSSKKILVTEPALNSKSNRQKLTETIFEEFNFGALNVSMQAVLVLYAQGLMTGLVVECGEGVTQIVPVYEGFISQSLIKRHVITGRNITKVLRSLLQQRGYISRSVVDIETIRSIKERYCFVACNKQMEHKLSRETTCLCQNYRLPDGTTIKIGQESYHATEAYFDPAIAGYESKGISDVIFDTIQEADIDCRMDYYQNIILSGGSSMFPGMSKRLETEIQTRYLKDILRDDGKRGIKSRIRVEAPSNRKYLVFLGASILGDLMKENESFWISKSDYEEHGFERLLESIS